MSANLNQLDIAVGILRAEGSKYWESTREFKKRFIMSALSANRGNKYAASRDLGIHRNTLDRHLADLGIDVKPFKETARALRKLPKSERLERLLEIVSQQQKMKTHGIG